VEDELEALEAELAKADPGRQIIMPDVPTKDLPAKDRAKAREEQRRREEDRVPHEAMLA
jgi:hypothetical protein